MYDLKTIKSGVNCTIFLENRLFGSHWKIPLPFIALAVCSNVAIRLGRVSGSGRVFHELVRALS
ncbi:uncharacterized protein PHALS_12293 [Plasmopara halstedii]|uniref:Uncharacterized protein n=1 Tax=Plasmopara halstedii TaxID=4781 RepID=A0A0P1ALU1_PLAHL|nr:uncharacterized protein PHALS_12293 [Plasmopara halstedii]CEG41986.1 hypothetical protein PHALS_12293 [Plasmopara halstedii]|eukprot:XP_024578355.1 hypothetical protein PHALS_12293 [Plasmopara halstedii]